MKNYVNQNPEQIARDKIDSMLMASRWDVQLALLRLNGRQREDVEAV